MSNTVAHPALEMRQRNLTELVSLLSAQHDQRHDIVQHSKGIRAEGGRLHVDGAATTFDWSGVTQAEGVYSPTAVFQEGAADKLGIPLAYLRKLHSEHPALWDANINGWLERDERKFMVRTFPGNGGQPGVARALLSDKYQIIDNLDVLTAALDGVARAGITVEIPDSGCDLTERRMYVRVVATNLEVAAPNFLSNYRAPSGAWGAANPLVSAGFVITNSELGGGAFSVAPRVVVQVCTNGMTVTQDAHRVVHIGARQDTGTIQWSATTNRKHLDLITAKTTDAVKHFLTRDYLTEFIAGIEARAANPIHEPESAIKTVCTTLKFTENQRADILSHFIKGGDVTAGGVMQAVTSVALTQTNGDTAAEMEASALRALEIAAKL